MRLAPSSDAARGGRGAAARSRLPSLLLSMTLAAGALVPSAQANPFFVGRFDGLIGGPLSTRPFALYWNPAGLTAKGLALDAHLGLIARQGSYDRVLPADTPPEEAAVNGGLGTTSSRGALPSLAGRWGGRAGSLRLGFGAGAYIARAGTSNWDRHPEAPAQYPGAYDGPQRWGALSTSMVLLNYSVGGAVGWGPLDVGVSLSYVSATLSTAKASNADKSDDLVDTAGDVKEGRIFLKNAEGGGLHLGAGAQLKLKRYGLPVRLGVAWRQGVSYELEGVSYALFGAAESQARARLNLPVASSLLGSVGVQVARPLAVRLEYERQGWSILDVQRIVNADNGEELLPLERHFRDTNAYRARVDVRVAPSLTLHAGVSYEEGATPAAYHEPGLAENDQVEGGAGVTWRLTPSLELHSSFMWQHFFERAVTNSAQKPTLNGVYTDERQYLTLDLTWRVGAAAPDTRASAPASAEKESP